MNPRFGYVGEHRTRLGESPLWDAALGRLWWIDAIGQRIARAAPDGSDHLCWDYDQPIGSIGLAENGLIAALADGFYHIAANGGAATPIATMAMAPGLRFNDGKADRHGRFLSATMKASDFTARDSALWRLDADGRATCIESGFGIGNALCFSPDGGTLYFADSLEGVVRRYAYDGATGAISARDDFLDTRPLGSGPDGATIDCDGRLWVALIHAQAVACFKPDGTLIAKIDLPLPYPSCPAFGGPDLSTLFVTSISDSGHSIRAEGPTAGRILTIDGLTIDGLGATGLPEGRYAGTHA